MANKQKSGILGTNKDERNKVLHKNSGKYNLYNEELNVIVGKKYDVYKRNDTVLEQNPDILRYTHGGQTEFSKDIYNRYGIDAEKMMYYSHVNINPSYKVNNFDGFGDYISYMFDIYGKDETYAGHLMGLMGVRDLAEKLELDVTPDFKGKTAQDVINEILQYSSVDYALESDRVGIVKDINVAMALAGRVTTNINNYSGKESKMGLISNTMYGLSLLKGATLNSMRRTNYITPEMDTLYGNNLSNIYNLSSLFRINDETGRIADPVTDYFISELPNGNVFDYLTLINPEFKLPESGYDWSTHPNYGVENKYFGISKSNVDNEYIVPEGDDRTLVNSDRQLNKGIVNDSYRVYSEGSMLGESITMFSGQETSDGFSATPIVNLEREDILKKTNEFLNNRKAHTMISRFHDAENQENSLTQSAVYKNFGISHGRNLLTKDSYNNGTPSSNANGYSNPYCRVWTNHHQYSKMKHLIRPFITDETFTSIGDLQKNWTMFRTEEGAKRLSDYSVLNKNGMVNITPVKDKIDVKNCMFSIENLAWKDVLTDKKGKYRLSVEGDMQEDNDNVLSEEQRGPNGGRIMWFPPYDLTFQETSNAKWSENEFIGRGEPVFTYVNSTRSGNLEFSMLVDHPSVINYWLMNKENTEENEQTLLRYFAGCETIDPDEDVIEQIMNGSYSGNTKDPVETEMERDIVFYTFFPNNFSGVGLDAEEAVGRIFGGMGKDIFPIRGNVTIGENSPQIVIHGDKIVVSNKTRHVTFEYSVENIDSSDNNPIKCKFNSGGNIAVINVNGNKIDVFINEDDFTNPQVIEIEVSHPSVLGIVILKIGVPGVGDNTDFPDDFNGMGDELEYGGIDDNTYFLGYEMGVNPMSLDNISYEDVVRNDTWYLDEVYDLLSAEKKFGDLSNFTQRTTIGLDDVKTSAIKDYNFYCEAFESSYSDYDEMEFRQSELSEEINLLESDIADIDGRIEVLEIEKGELEEGSSAYYTVEYEISKLQEQSTSLRSMQANKRKIYDSLDTTKENIEENRGDLLSAIEDVEMLFSNIEEWNKTNPLYIFFEYNGNDTYSGATITSSASEAFAKYKITNVKTYFTKSAEEKPYEFLNEKEEVICSSKYGKDENSITYWVAECKESQNIPYQPFNNKRKFSKSQFDFGMSDGSNKEYYVKYGGQTYEFKNITDKKTGENKSGKQQADTFIVKNNIIPEFINKQQFEESGKLYGYNSETKRYYYYDLVSTSKTGALQKIQDVLNNEGDNDYIVGKYYENHKFGCIEDFGFRTNYGVIQFFYTGKLHETGEAYETVQDFIARHNVRKNCPEDKKVMNDEVIRFESQGVTKYLTKDQKDKKGYVTANINWNLKEPVLSYPVDEGKEGEILRAMNYYDMESFGLNSTLEVVKKETGDESVTFSFGEVYAALKGDKERDYVLACERGILKSVLKLEGAELEEKVKEAEERIDYLKNVFNPKDGVKTMNIKEVLTLGAASSHGYTEKNKVLANNRENTIKDFLKTFPIMKDVDMSKIDADGQLTNSIMEVSKEFDKDINDITAKKGRQAKITIVVGEKDAVPAKVEETTEDATATEGEVKVRKNRRYDNEYLFFKLLEENDNVAYKRLVDKVKYFSPAFHSITPEGFNARLTFLHQCTRQGPTSSASDMTSGSTASNLAFGRAPFCVLRLGDFLNTKIVITSVNITYPDTLWDLNPDGIGAQFMMAKVNMQIHILGGSDISAPIKRLQNAVSFNYYANTSIYDDRSDIAEYDKDGKSIVNKRQWFVDLNKNNS